MSVARRMENAGRRTGKQNWTRVGVGIAWIAIATGCLPYSMASTAATVAPGEVRVMSSMSVVGAAGSLRSDADVRLPMYDLEARGGIDDRTDVGARMTSSSGLVVSYKRRLAGQAEGGPALSGQVEGGFVNLGLHGLVGASLIASGRESNTAAPFGGVRMLAVAPLSRHAVQDSPTLGGFAGVRLGNRSFAVLPEVGVFYDRSALGLRRANWIVVPTVSWAFGPRAGRSLPRRVWTH